ncbi:OmpA/MotB [unidentified eubacterium SCB49]|nr:OmpA/MotB [unidentified eubacterium SCB49]
MAKQEDKLQLLRDILLIDDRQVADAISERLKTVTKTLEEQEALSEKVNPIIEEKLEEFVKEIPATLGPTITKTLKEEIANSKDQVVEALYPIIGKMIKRYIASEIAKLSESINSKVNNTFSLSYLKRKVKTTFTGTKEGDLVLSELDKPNINQIFAIQKGSGILLGDYSLTDTIDKDMLSGMLTAIKSFVEDAFNGGSQSLESIQYELYSIHIQNFHSYYIAVVISGSYTKTYESLLEDKLYKVSRKLSSSIHTLKREEVDSILKALFKEWKDQNK